MFDKSKIYSHRQYNDLFEVLIIGRIKKKKKITKRFSILLSFSQLVAKKNVKLNNVSTN